MHFHCSHLFHIGIYCQHELAQHHVLLMLGYAYTGFSAICMNVRSGEKQYTDSVATKFVCSKL